MKILLTNPCTVDLSSMRPSSDGYFCSSCQKNVVDYTGMTNAQMLYHIQKKGLGCGVWDEDQLNIDLKLDNRPTGAYKIFYAALISLIWFRPYEANAQSVPDTLQSNCKANSYKRIEQANPSLDNSAIIAYGNGTKRFGGAILIETKRYKSYGIFIGKIRIILFRKKV